MIFFNQLRFIELMIVLTATNLAANRAIANLFHDLSNILSEYKLDVIYSGWSLNIVGEEQAVLFPIGWI